MAGGAELEELAHELEQGGGTGTAETDELAHELASNAEALGIHGDGAAPAR